MLGNAVALKEEQRFRRHPDFLASLLPTARLIEETVCGPAGRARLVPVGSLATHLSLEGSSDLDLCFLPADPRFLEEFGARHNFKT